MKMSKSPFRYGHEYISRQEVASDLGVSAGRVSRMLEDGVIPAEKRGDGWRINGKTYYNWSAKRRVAGGAYGVDMESFDVCMRLGIALIASQSRNLHEPSVQCNIAGLDIACNGYEPAELAGIAASLTLELVSGVMAMNQEELRIRLLDAPVTVQYEVMMERLAAEYGIADTEAFSQRASRVYKDAVEESRKLKLRAKQERE